MLDMRPLRESLGYDETSFTSGGGSPSTIVLCVTSGSHSIGLQEKLPTPIGYVELIDNDILVLEIVTSYENIIDLQYWPTYLFEKKYDIVSSI